MYVPATPAPAQELAPAAIVSVTPASFVAPVATPIPTLLKVGRTRLNVLEDQQATVGGMLLEGHRHGLPGRTVTFQALGRHGWRTLARTHTGRGGRFRLSYRSQQVTSDTVRVRFAGEGGLLPARRRLGRLNVFRLALASWYGGGGETACGGALTSGTMGVANKTLPCGTLVTLRYDGHSVRVPVIDRGPFVAGREFDLTEATKSALGFGGVGEVWSTR